MYIHLPDWICTPTWAVLVEQKEKFFLKVIKYCTVTHLWLSAPCLSPCAGTNTIRKWQAYTSGSFSSSFHISVYRWQYEHCSCIINVYKIWEAEGPTELPIYWLTPQVLTSNAGPSQSQELNSGPSIWAAGIRLPEPSQLSGGSSSREQELENKLRLGIPIQNMGIFTNTLVPKPNTCSSTNFFEIQPYVIYFIW